MSIDKSIRQHYAIQDGKRIRFLHGAMGASATPGATSGGQSAREPGAVVTTAVAPPSILSRPDPVETLNSVSARCHPHP